MNFLERCFMPLRGRAQLIRSMRITAVLLLAASLHVAAAGYAQKVTLSMHHQPLEKVLSEISRQSGIEILFNNDLLQKEGPVSVSVQDADAREVLATVLKNTAFTFKSMEGMVIITPKVAVTEIRAVPPPGTITGTVTGPDGKPVANVTVTNKTTRKATQTDAGGAFSIQASDNDILEFSAIGYAHRLVSVPADRHTLQLSLATQASNLNEVVMIGYGSTTRKDLTGAVSTVSGKDIQDVPFETVDNAIAGKAAGVQVTKTDGTPGGAVRIRVRGTSSLLGGNEPLYVIDGVPVQVQSNFIDPGYGISNAIGNDVNASSGGVAAGMSTGYVNGLNSLGGLNPDDIESISILKDASATAIYGSKASNGVVIITTKHGRKEMAPQITFNYYGTGAILERKPHLLNATQYRTLLTEAAVNDNAARDGAGTAHQALADTIVRDPNGYFGKANTDWIDAVTHTTFSNNAEIAVQGGGAGTRYYTSLAYTDVPGNVIGTNFHRIVGKVNLETDISKKFRFLTNLNIGYTTQAITNGAYDEALKARPDYTPYDSTGAFTNFANVGYSYQGFQNPKALTTATNNSTTTSILGSVSAVYDILPDLQYKGTVSLNDQIYNQRTYTPSYLEIGSYFGSVANNGGIGSNSNSRFADWFVENTITWNKRWNDRHSVNVLAGTSYETQKTSFFSATGTGYPNDNVLTSLSSATTPTVVTGDDPTKPQAYLLSFYLRANYTFDDKYLVTFTGRSDGSSKFGPDNKFGYFPSGALGWRLSKEAFLSNVNWLDELKIRASYGATGNQNIGDQLYRTLYKPYNYAGSSALVPTQLGNPAVKWETTRQLDLGLDFAILKNRLSGTFDYYNKQTEDALLQVPTAPSSAFSYAYGNVVGIRNRGFELYLQGEIVQTKNFKWTMAGNITWNRTLVTKISSKDDLSQALSSPTGIELGNTTLEQGQPLGLITGMHVTGIIRNTQELANYKSKLGVMNFALPYLGIGDPMFELDTTGYNGQGGYPKFNAILAAGAPKYTGGFNEAFSYKNWDLSLYFTFSEGGHLMWGDDVSSLYFAGTSNANAVMLNRYTPENTTTNQPRLLLNDQLLYASNLSIFNSSYLKLRTVTLDYRLNKTPWMRNSGFQGATVYASATNIFTITKYPGNDPETSDDSYSVAGGYFDVSNYPALRSVSLGIKLAF